MASKNTVSEKNLDKNLEKLKNWQHDAGILRSQKVKNSIISLKLRLNSHT